MNVMAADLDLLIPSKLLFITVTFLNWVSLNFEH